MSLRVEDIRDVEIARQVAKLALDENERLYRRLEAMARENAELKGESGAKQFQLEMLRLKEQNEKLKRQCFAASSEKRSRERDGAAGGKPHPPNGPREQRELPLEEQVHELTGNDRRCDSCGLDMVEWDGQHEETEEVDVVQREFVLKRHVRKKYRCKCGGAPKIAPRPPCLPGGGRYSLDFAVDVAVHKWGDHLPLERQVRIMRREGLDVESSTLWDQTERLARVLRDTHAALRVYVVEAEVVHADETPWPMLKKGSKKHWVWSIGRRDAVYYAIDPSRGHRVILELLEGFGGLLVVDGYRAYGAAAKALDGHILLALCWSHARRKLVEAEQSYAQASEALDLISELFLIERDLPDWQAIDEASLRGAALERIREVRQQKSKPLIEALAAWAKAQRALPQSRLGDAIEYLDHYWDGLCLFLDDPRAPLTNNSAERSLRGPVVGRKNHYGSKSVRGTEVAALFYSLMESSKLAGVEPRAYLRAAAQAALKGKPPLLPHDYRRRLKLG